MTGARANGDDRARGLTGAAEWADGGKRGVGAHPSRPAGNNAGDRRTAGGGGRRDAASGSGEYAFWITGGYVHLCRRGRKGGLIRCRSLFILFPRSPPTTTTPLRKRSSAALDACLTRVAPKSSLGSSGARPKRFRPAIFPLGRSRLPSPPSLSLSLSLSLALTDRICSL